MADADDNAESLPPTPPVEAEDDIFSPKQPADADGKSLSGSVGTSEPAAESAPKLPRRKRLTPTQRKLIRVLSRNPEMTLEEAGRRAGFTSKPAQQASATLRKPSIQEAFREAMEKHPALKRESIINKLAEGLEAQQIKFFAHEGNVQDERTTTDFGVRHSYLALIAKLGGLEPTTKTELTGANGTPLLPGGALLDLSWISKDQLIRLIGMTEYPIEPPRSSDANPIIDAELVTAISGAAGGPAAPGDAQEAGGGADEAADGPEEGS